MTAHGDRIPGSVGVRIADPSLKVEEMVSGLDHPMSMAFLNSNDILVLEKNKGTVQRIINGTIQPKPVLDVDVANKGERGMLGIASSPKSQNGHTYVFIYFTETKVEGSDDCPKPDYYVPGNTPLGNRLYRYELSNDMLVKPKLLMDLPALPGPAHNGGKVVIGPDKNLYFTIGDLVAHKTRTQNYPDEEDFNGTSAIYRITQDGRPLPNGPLGKDNGLNNYYAYGIRNSFGIDFDPITGILWDTENGPKFGDEINFVEPGFNSGWTKIHGTWNVNAPLDKAGISPTDPKGLVDFNHKGKYSPPEFVWDKPIGVTALKFFNSTSLGKNYENSIFVGDVNLGYLYNFKLNPDRMSLLFDNSGPLSDKVADSPYEMQKGGIILGKGFGTITEIQVGPDGNLYVLNLFGDIYRISSVSAQ